MSYAEIIEQAAARPDGPSRKQIDFILKLAGERVDVKLGLDGMERMENVGMWLERTATKRDVTAKISWLLRQPVDQREVVSQIPAPRAAVSAAKTIDPGLTPGVYDVNGHVFVVKSNQAKTRLYAKQIVESPDRLNANGELVDIDFVYAPGAIFDIKPEHRMAFEDAKVLTIRYGRCINCGKVLKAGKSVERGIGPVCRKLFA